MNKKIPEFPKFRPESPAMGHDPAKVAEDAIDAGIDQPSILQLLERVTLPSEAAERRKGESAFEFSLRTLPATLSALAAYGPLPEKATVEDCRFYEEMLAFLRKDRLQSRTEKFSKTEDLATLKEPKLRTSANRRFGDR